jgi:thiol:disulfide interchange protein DsbD
MNTAMTTRALLQFHSCVVAALAAAAPSADAQPAPARRVQAPHTVVELLVDRQPDTATRELWMGLRFEMEQGWHIYWTNPGDSGAPPYVLWQPVPGLSLGEFEWPTPERIPLGPLMNYGYSNEVVLPFPVRLAKPLAGQPISLQGEVKWMICSDICIPGQTRLALTLPLSTEDRARTAAWRQQIEQARKLVPQPAPTAWRASASATTDGFVLTVRMDRPAAPATFFSLEPNQIAESAPQEAKTNGRELVLRLRRANDRANPRMLRGVLAFSGGPSYVVEAPLTGATPRRSGAAGR